MDADQKKKCDDLLESFMRLNSAEPFLERVNWEEWGLYDYLQVVKVPMDLGTIRQKLQKSAYATPSEFVNDVRLVWDNCKLYNQEGSELHAIATKLAKRFDDRVRTLRLDLNASAAPSRTAPAAVKTTAARTAVTTIAPPPPTMEERIRFGQNLYRVSTKDLGAIVAKLEAKCPKALDKTSPDELDVVVDAIETATFRDLEAFVLKCIPNAAATTPKRSATAAAVGTADSDVVKRSKTAAQ